MHAVSTGELRLTKTKRPTTGHVGDDRPSQSLETSLSNQSLGWH